MGRQLGSAFGVALLVAVLGETTTLTAADLCRGSMLVIASALITLLTGVRRTGTNGESARIEVRAPDQQRADSVHSRR